MILPSVFRTSATKFATGEMILPSVFRTSATKFATGEMILPSVFRTSATKFATGEMILPSVFRTSAFSHSQSQGTRRSSPRFSLVSRRCAGKYPLLPKRTRGQKVPPCLVGIEACASCHYWSRQLRAPGHTVRLLPAGLCKALWNARRAVTMSDQKRRSPKRNNKQKRPAKHRDQHADVCARCGQE